MYPVDLHTHTIASTHAYSTIHDYIAVAKQKGVKLFATTDHGPSMTDAPHMWHFVNLIVIPRIVDGVGILRGIEANICNIRGDIDCNERMLQQLDLIIAGFHEQVFEPSDLITNTDAMIATMRNGLVHIISHPGNPKFPVDINAIAEAAAEYNVALEINDSSFYRSRVGSSENCKKIAEAVGKAGGVISLGSDSHIAYTLADYSHCLPTVEMVSFPQERILNVTPRRVLDFLQQRTGKIITEFNDF